METNRSLTGARARGGVSTRLPDPVMTHQRPRLRGLLRAVLPAQQVRQLGDIRSNAPRLIFAEQLGRRLPPRLTLNNRSGACTHKSRSMSNGWSMSALPPKADIAERYWHVSFGPQADSCTVANNSVI
jgi:hypothetical protein